MRTNPSGENPTDAAQPPVQGFSALPSAALQNSTPMFPAQIARMNTSFSTSDIAALNAAQHSHEQGSSFCRPNRSSSTAHLSSLAPAPSPQALRSPEISGSTGPMHLDGSEPRIFPGAISRRQTSSIQGAGGSSYPERDGETWSSLKKSGGDDAVAEEEETEE